MLQATRVRSAPPYQQQSRRGRTGAGLRSPRSALRKFSADEPPVNIGFREHRQAVLGYVREQGRIDQPHSLKPELHRSPQHAEPVDHAASEIDRRCFREVLRRTADLTDPKPEMDRLYQHLVVKDKVVRIVS